MPDSAARKDVFGSPSRGTPDAQQSHGILTPEHNKGERMVITTGTEAPSGVGRETFVGRDGLQRLQGMSRFRASDAAGFRADWRSMRLADGRFESFRVTACSGSFEPQPAGEPEVLQLGTVVMGRSGWTKGDPDQERGRVHLLRGFDRVQFEWPEPVHFLALKVPAASLPTHLLEEGVLVTGVLPRSPLMNGFSGFLRQLAAGPTTPNAAERTHLDRALLALVASVLATAATDEHAGADELRFAIHDYIERNIADPDLGPRRIAASLDVSLRWVHRVFNVGGQSIARYIRDRRVDMVAEVLRSDPRVARMSRLSEQFGFGGRDQLARAFRARYGTTVREYQECVRTGRPLPLPMATPSGSADDQDLAESTVA
jgi:AraC-like DNA-binding protein